MPLLENIDKTRIPQHVAIIMDGNGRWAKQHEHDRTYGHERGVEVVCNITEIASKLGLKYLTLYAFSTENWKRPQTEVDVLMALIVSAIEKETPKLIKNNVRLSMIGDISRMPEYVQNRLQSCITATAHCTGLNLVLALSYSSRWELTNAMKNIANEVKNGTLDVANINDDTIISHLTTADIPDPDLLIRTGGDIRISNFLLWQIAYAELYFIKDFWPDFSEDKFCEAIIEYQKRERRYGMISEQLQ